MRKDIYIFLSNFKKCGMKKNLNDKEKKEKKVPKNSEKEVSGKFKGTEQIEHKMKKEGKAVI
ncbi:MAG: hypothetical protein WAO79_07380 [Methanosarcina flavescens]|uniref:Uncharacterized protein n=2 Tax=Methanosarcina flavescens TaxID=1715806 RepID=A0A660HSK0_9EURY|nr:hypothetical protein [Methanosarcina flavescens]AYK15291.1 hypothetical protein AOB57_008875 [Methanosarcina flavescens]